MLGLVEVSLAVVVAVVVAVSFLAVPGSAGPVQCPDSSRAGCSPPHWDVRWDMAGSTYTYCFGHCPLAWLANNTQLGTWGGVVGVDHYWTNQGMPCVNGRPQEFEHQDAFANATKTTFPRSKVLEYRITDAVPYAGIVHDKMVSNPEFFVRWTHPPTNNGSICLMPYVEHGTGLPGDNCTWEIRAGAYDWSQEQVREWYLDNIIKPTRVVADGAWIDGDGPDNGAYMCSGSYDYGNLPAPYPALNVSEIAAFCQGEAQVVQAAQEWLIANGGFDYNCFDFISSNLPANTDTPAQCAAKVKALDHRPTKSAIVLYASRTDSEGYTDDTAAQAVATFMLVRDQYWFFGLKSGSNELNTTTAALMLTDFGAPLANMTSPQPNVFSRPYEKATVSLDCNTFSASFDPVSV